MPDVNEPYAYIEHEIAQMEEMARGLRIEVVRLMERADTLEYRARSLRSGLVLQKKADGER